MKFLLDTCTFLWAIEGGGRLSGEAREAFTAAENEVYLSAISAWEIALKNALGKLPLPAPVERFVPMQRRRHSLESLPLNEESALQVAKLPVHHRDPFDRMLISQAIVHGLTILTPDLYINRYAVRVLW